MGLTDDIYEVMKISAESGAEAGLDDVQANNLYNTAQGIADAVVTFLTKQTFTITEMKSILEVEEISTTGPVQGDVLSTVTIVNGFGPGNVVNGTKGVLIPTVNLKKFGGQGGAMKAVGHAYIGRNPVDNEETNEDLTKVKLLRDNIIGI